MAGSRTATIIPTSAPYTAPSMAISSSDNISRTSLLLLLRLQSTAGRTSFEEQEHPSCAPENGLLPTSPGEWMCPLGRRAQQVFTATLDRHDGGAVRALPDKADRARRGPKRASQGWRRLASGSLVGTKEPLSATDGTGIIG
jgi:hypothetical protein